MIVLGQFGLVRPFLESDILVGVVAAEDHAAFDFLTNGVAVVVAVMQGLASVKQQAASD